VDKREEMANSKVRWFIAMRPGKRKNLPDSAWPICSLPSARYLNCVPKRRYREAEKPLGEENRPNEASRSTKKSTREVLRAKNSPLSARKNAVRSEF
jgi:hypothetical protein